VLSTYIIVITIALVAVPVFVSIYRAESLLAFYIIGIPMVLFVVETLRLPWNTVMTGMIRVVLFIPVLFWWWLSRPKPDELLLPRRFGFNAAIIMMLFLLWEAKYFYEGQYLGAEVRYERLKWAYCLQDWGAALLLGFMMPLTYKRLQRLLGALGAIGIIWATFEMGAFLLGKADMTMEKESEYERYQFAASVGSLGLGINTAIGASGLLGWFLMKNRAKPSQSRNIFVGVCIGVMAFAVLLTGSRGPMVSMFATLIIFLFLLGGRNAIRFGLALIVLGVLVYISLQVVPDSTKNRLFGSLGTGAGGRWQLFVNSLAILRVSPFLGQTRGIISLTGIAYSHQIFSQILVETGLVGLAMYLVAAIPTMVRWTVAAFRRQSEAWTFAGPLCVWLAFEVVQRNMAAGNIACADFWVIVGIMMGHRLVPRSVAYSYAEGGILTEYGPSAEAALASHFPQSQW